MVGQSCIATDLELIYYVQKRLKGIVIYEKYIHVYIQITRLLPISFGSIDIKESAVGALVSSILNLFECWRDGNNRHVCLKMGHVDDMVWIGHVSHLESLRTKV